MNYGNQLWLIPQVIPNTWASANISNHRSPTEAPSMAQPEAQQLHQLPWILAMLESDFNPKKNGVIFKLYRFI